MFNVEQLNEWFSEAYPEFADAGYNPADEWPDDLWDD